LNSTPAPEPPTLYSASGSVIESLTVTTPKFLFVARLLICLFPFNLSADAPRIRVSIIAKANGGEESRLLSSLSNEFRKLDGVQVTDEQPTVKIICTVTPGPSGLARALPGLRYDYKKRSHSGEAGNQKIGYAAAVAMTDAEDNFKDLFVQMAYDIDSLAKIIATKIDSDVIEKIRRTAQPSPTP